MTQPIKPASIDRDQAPVRGVRRLLVRFRREKDGATAVEFALLLTPFLMLLFAIFEIAMMFWTSQVLEEATTQASRTLLTGQSQTLYATGSASAKAAAFKDTVCGYAPNVIDCNKLVIDVRSYTDFAGAKAGTDANSPFKNGGLDVSGFSYAQPLPGQTVVVRSVLPYSLMLGAWSTALVDIGGGERALVAATAFQAEPFTVLEK